MSEMQERWAAAKKAGAGRWEQMALMMMITPHLKAYELHSRPLAASKKCNIVLGMRSPCHSQQRRQARASTGFIVAVVLQAVPLLCWTRGRTLMPVET